MPHKIRPLLLSILLLLPVLLSGNGQGRICGTIRCHESGAPLGAVNVYLKGTSLGAASESNGNYCIYDISPGDYTVIFRMIGYKTREFPGISVSEGETVTLDVYMNPTVLEYDQDITVTSTRGPTLVTDVPASVNVLDTDAPEYQNAQNLGEILQNIQGVFIKDQGGLGNTKTISLRGSTAGQVVVLLDGQRINNPQTGEVDLSTLSLEGVEKIEVVRGSNSALYGADAIGGVVNIITRSDEQKKGGWQGSVKTTGASFGTFSLESTVDAKIKRWDLSGSGKYLHSRGDFTFTDNYGQKKTRKNADIESTDLHGRLATSLGEGLFTRHLEFTLRHHESERGAPGTIEPYYYRARMWDKQNQANMLLNSKIFSCLHELRWQNYYYDSWSRYFNDESLQKVDSRFTTRTGGSEIQVRSILEDWSTLTYGSGIRLDYMQDHQTSDERLRTSAYFFTVSENQLPVQILGMKKLSLVPSLRYDWNSDYPNRFSPKIGLVFNWGERWLTSLKMNAGLSYRAPTFNDLYWPEDVWTKGNPNLSPENGMDWDMGIRLQYPVLNGFYLESTYFENYLSDMIIWQETDGLWMPENVQSARIRGIENSLKFSPLKNNLTFQANYTFMDARNTNPESPAEYEKILFYRPKHTVNVSLTARILHIYGTYSYQYVSRRYTDATNVWKNSLDPYSLSHISLGYEMAYKTFRLTVNTHLKNLFDTEYRVIKNMPVPGREWRVSLTVEKK
jgi:outer membrane receptor for ferrienterochelin and colicins